MDSPVELVKAALLRAANTPTSLFTPEPFVGVKEYGDSAITYVLQVWSGASDYWATYFAVNEAIHQEFARDGIENDLPPPECPSGPQPLDGCISVPTFGG
ncbi:MAG: hypothetical protein ACLU9S_06930 [Oscillospiraceae bacterium]